MNKIGFLIALSAGIIFSTITQAEKAHQHGMANLNIAISKHNLIIDLDTPADNILGFEHSPETKKQKKQLAKSLSQLKQANMLIKTSPKSECTLKQVKIDNPFDSHKMGHDDEHEEHKETHSDFEATYTYNCKSPIKNISFAGLFSHFPRMKKITTQWVNENKQSAKVITKKTPTIKFTK